MSEKGDLPQDTDSLPPNYASSEAFTDSPPPAYRKTNTVRLQVTRAICFTVLVAGFLTGAFILAHTWITTRNQCDCPQVNSLNAEDASFLEASSLKQVQAALENSIPSAAVNEPTEEQLQDMDTKSRQLDIELPEEEEDLENSRLEVLGKALEDEKDSLQTLVEEVQKNVKLPQDLILGNPALVGKDVQCKVEKKMQHLGAGIMSKTIIVTCDDDDEDEEESSEETSPEGPFGSRPPPIPPMSLFAPILKMIAARASARLQNQFQPKPAFQRFPQPFMQPAGFPMNAPRLIPFPKPMDMHINMPRPMSREIPSGPREELPFPPPQNFKNFISLTRGAVPPVFARPQPIPGNSVVRPNISPIPFLPPQAMGPQFREVENRPFLPEDQQDGDEEVFPFPNHIRGNINDEPSHPQPPVLKIIRTNDAPESVKNAPIKVIHGFPPQMPEALKQIISHIVSGQNSKEQLERSPVIKIKAIPDIRPMEPNPNMPKSKLMLPFPFRAVKMIPRIREARKLDNEEPREEMFPFQRGTISPEPEPHMPEAAGRALDSPVALPAVSEMPSIRFFPGRILRLPVPLRRAITHMEMKQSPNHLPSGDEEPQIEDGNQESDGPDFGPPRLHTVIRGPPPAEDNVSQDSVPLPPFLQRLPPPPKFAREGRSGIVKEINPDAEMIKPAETSAHHMIMVN